LSGPTYGRNFDFSSFSKTITRISLHCNDANPSKLQLSLKTYSAVLLCLVLLSDALFSVIFGSGRPRVTARITHAPLLIVVRISSPFQRVTSHFVTSAAVSIYFARRCALHRWNGHSVYGFEQRSVSNCSLRRT